MVHIHCSRSEMLQFDQEDGLSQLRILSVSLYSNNCVGETSTKGYLGLTCICTALHIHIAVSEFMYI